MSYTIAALVGGVVLPVGLHVLAPERMPWWPDTISTAIVFGIALPLILAGHRRQRRQERRLWAVLKTVGRRSHR